MGLRIIHQGGNTVDLADEITVGRDAVCTFPLSSDSAVSRRHARFLWLHGLPMVEDLGSSNGTFLNGARVTQARPVSSGDEIRIGSSIFRIEAVLDGTPTPQPTPANVPKEMTRSERRQQRNRRFESSGAEGTLYGNHGSGDPLKGCALPNIDLSGCVKYLWILLLILLAALLIGLIIFGVGALISAVGGVGSSISGAGGGSSGSTGAGTSPDGGQAAPPPNTSPPPPQNQPPQNQPQQGGLSAEGIRIEEVKVDFAKRGGAEAKPVVLIKWLNFTKGQVKRLSGTVYVYGRDGKLILEIPRERLYEGPPVSPGEGHQDTLTQGGVVVQQKLSGAPASAKVTVERIE